MSLRANQILESKYRRLSRNFSSLWRLVNNNNRDSRSMYRNQLGAHWANESIFLPVSPVFIYTTAQPSTSPISPDTQYMDPTSSPSPPTQTPLMESATYIPNYYHQFQCNQHKI
ncbi:Hypothetical protein CINCED_3A013633 [Cinara cedri]|uniref:Uncharacterized protein n=1 Tax=Cinara cedri TaxID=506608 RepID=A0A5E4NS76_9HEMI|nr:Hypothetical protein CINCED_3A013633 [Cinara cedri]